MGSVALAEGLALAWSMENEVEVTDASMWLWVDKVVGFCGSFHFTVSIFSIK